MDIFQSAVQTETFLALRKYFHQSRIGASAKKNGV